MLQLKLWIEYRQINMWKYLLPATKSAWYKSCPRPPDIPVPTIINFYIPYVCDG